MKRAVEFEEVDFRGSRASGTGGAEPRAIREDAPRGRATLAKIAGGSGLRNFFYLAFGLAVFVGILALVGVDDPVGYLIGVGVGFVLAFGADVLGGRAEHAAAAWLEANGEVFSENAVEAERRIREDYADAAVAALDKTEPIVFSDRKDRGGEKPTHWQVTSLLAREFPSNEGGYVVDAQEWAAYKERVRARCLGIPVEAIPSGVWVLDWKAAEERVKRQADAALAEAQAEARGEAELRQFGAAGAIARMLPEYENMPEADRFEWLAAQYGSGRRPVLQWAILEELNKYGDHGRPNLFLSDELREKLFGDGEEG